MSFICLISYKVFENVDVAENMLFFSNHVYIYMCSVHIFVVL